MNYFSRRFLKDQFEGEAIFDTVKPVGLIHRMLRLAGVEDGEMVLDFFAGSGSTGVAVLEGGAARFMLVQLPEEIDDSKPHGKAAKKLGFDTVSDITLGRLKQACGNGQGFRVFKLAGTNLRIWNPDPDDLDATLLDHQDHLMGGRSDKDVLYELLLKRGVDLAVPIENLELAGKTIYSIGYGVLFACLDESITKDQVEEIGQGIVEWHRELAPSSDTHVFFRDSAFSDDVSKTNMAAILEQNGINHVRSL